MHENVTYNCHDRNAVAAPGFGMWDGQRGQLIPYGVFQLYAITWWQVMRFTLGETGFHLGGIAPRAPCSRIFSRPRPWQKFHFQKDHECPLCFENQDTNMDASDCVRHKSRGRAEALMPTLRQSQGSKVSRLRQPKNASRRSSCLKVYITAIA